MRRCGSAQKGLEVLAAGATDELESRAGLSSVLQDSRKGGDAAGWSTTTDAEMDATGVREMGHEDDDSSDGVEEWPG